MSSYFSKLKDPRWQRKRLGVMQRDDFKCRDCGTTTNTLHVHHCLYEKGDPWDTSDRFLLTLCATCHVSRGELESDAKRALGMLVARMSHRPDDNQLDEFVESLVHAASGEIPNPIIVDEAEMFGLWNAAQRAKPERSE